MESNVVPLAPPADSETRRALKRVARRLIAERGARSVTVREIAEAAGQRNRGAVAYYFGSKERLLAEILIDGAERIDARRALMLAAMEAEGGPRDVAEAVAAIVIPSAELSVADAEHGAFYNGFLLQVSTSDPAFVDRTLEGHGNQTYQRCLEHLRVLMSVRERPVQNRRFVFLGLYVSALLAQREAMFADRLIHHPTWRSDDMLHDMVRTAAALLDAPTND